MRFILLLSVVFIYLADIGYTALRQKSLLKLFQGANLQDFCIINHLLTHDLEVTTKGGIEIMQNFRINQKDVANKF